MTLRKLQGGWGRVTLYRSLQQRAGSLNIKILLLIMENQISQLKEFYTFLCMGRCKSLGSLKSFLSYASLLSEATILTFLSPAQAPQGSPWEVAGGCYEQQIFFFLGALWAQKFTLDGLESLITVILIYWYGRKFSISQCTTQ